MQRFHTRVFSSIGVDSDQDLHAENGKGKPIAARRELGILCVVVSDGIQEGCGWKRGGLEAINIDKVELGMVGRDEDVVLSEIDDEAALLMNMRDDCF